jgi:hydroxyacyl-ACP dehydratase HTD2-like protein with hotdog domain
MPATKLRPSTYYEDVSAGMELPPLTKQANEVQLFFFSAATWDSHRTHWDIPYSVNVEKLPGILVHGHLQGAFLSQAVTDWAGPLATLRKISYQNRGMAIQTDVLTVKGRVKEKREENGKGLVTCEVWLEKQTGDVTTTGEATVELPRRGR